MSNARPSHLVSASRHILATLASVFLGVSHVVAASPRQAEVGDILPTAILTDAKGNPFNVSEAVREKPAVLVFYRGGWCPYCNAQLSALVEIEDDLASLGYQLLAISPDQPSKLHDAPKREVEPTYALVSDQDLVLAEALGIAFEVPAELVDKYKNSYSIDLEAASGRTHHKLPHPAVFVVDRQGVIRFVHVDPDYRKRLDPAKILTAAKTAADAR
ncbi:peroxiredoxin-like family protein [Opitutales bacterium ASA1]|uniref:peroxiredoxin-like family protein n=1 Tax=Congregicoccus parvus TaxID=3081749 RepID=UPI002B30AB85|nr:peroxiredoxin-like family protein [Opitutales bacterium ASA1]